MSEISNRRSTSLRSLKFGVYLVLGVWSLVFPTTSPAQSTPRIGYTYPAGGQVGSTFQVKVGGQFLDGVTNAYFSGAGLQATVVEHFKPISQQQFNNLRERLQELQKAKRDAATLKEIAEIRARMSTFVRRPATPALVEHAVLRVTIATNVAPGKRELRLRTPAGLSNPLVFYVGQLPEFRKSEPREEPDDGRRPIRQNLEQRAVAATEIAITLPATVNGQILPGGVDRFRFRARQGQQLVAAVCARELMPYLADAVPGWFQATLALRDDAGREIAYDDDFRFHPDPVLHFKIPQDGEYRLEIKDAIYRGREDFVYRLSVGELPFVTSLFPLGGKMGESTEVELHGWNLSKLKLTKENKALGVKFITTRDKERLANPMPFVVDDLPEASEHEPNNTSSTAQRVSLPVILNGRVAQSGDDDIFRFEGRAGEEIVAEVTARRSGSPLDSVLKLTDAEGKQIAFNDDNEDKAYGLNTHHADAYLRATLPADGAYFVQLGETQRKGGGEYAYRLRLSAPQPDFALRIVPSSVNVRRGSSASLTVHALRRDGFTNEITLRLQDAQGFKLGSARVPAGAEQAKITLTAPPTPLVAPVALSLEGRAAIGGESVSRRAVPADDMMQAFAYRHLVPAQELMVMVTERPGPRRDFRPAASAKVRPK